ARGEWSRVGAPTGPIAPRDACPLCVRLHGRRDRPSRHARAGAQLSPKAVYSGRPRAQGTGGARRDMMDEHDLHGELGRTLADRLIGERHTVALAHLLLLVIVMALAWGALPTEVAAVWAAAVLSATLARLVLWSRA